MTAGAVIYDAEATGAATRSQALVVIGRLLLLGHGSGGASVIVVVGDLGHGASSFTSQGQIPTMRLLHRHLRVFPFLFTRSAQLG